MRSPSIVAWASCPCVAGPSWPCKSSLLHGQDARATSQTLSKFLLFNNFSALVSTSAAGESDACAPADTPRPPCHKEVGWASAHAETADNGSFTANHADHANENQAQPKETKEGEKKGVAQPPSAGNPIE
jgi:hypothetical protein